MTALAADRLIRKRTGPDIVTVYGVAASAVMYQGGLVSVNPSGYAYESTSTFGDRVVGVCDAGISNAGGSNGAVNVTVRTNCYVLLNNSGTNPVAQADVGHPCWVQDDQTVCGGAGGSAVQAGIVDR